MVMFGKAVELYLLLNARKIYCDTFFLLVHFSGRIAIS